jgi:pyruvate dehydrogenase E2 component (dihydrolipoamide acetyltransferase)
MPSRVVMPKLTDTMEEGVVLKWKKHEGDTVAAGDVLAEIETDKAVMDLEAFASGVLRKVMVNEGQTVKAGALIGIIAESDEDIQAALKEKIAPSSAARPEAVPPDKPAAPSKAETKGPAAAGSAPPARLAAPSHRPAAEPQIAPKAARPTQAASPTEDRVKASPRAKALAAERGVDLTRLKGTGPDGRIVEEDVLKAPSRAGGRPKTSPVEPVPFPQAGDRPLSQMRKAIARTTTQSKAPVPHFYLTTEIAMDEAERLRSQIKQSRRFSPSLNDMIVKACAQALMRHPEINVSYTGESLRQHGTIDIGIAVALDEGLISPVLRDCGSKSLAQISYEAHELIERARNKRLQPNEYTGATFSVSNLGMYDVENFIAVLMPPEAAAIAVGGVHDVPVVDGKDVRIGRRMKVTLSCDHRALDGIQGAGFLQEFKRILEHPVELILPEAET